MRNLKILPYKMGSKSAKLLASHFGVKRIYANGRFKPNKSHLILNWGCNSTTVLNDDCTVLNKPKNVSLASNKVSSLQILKENNINCVEFTLNKEDALNWIKEGHVVYCRTLTRASEGKGIVVATKENELVNASLYTKYFKNLYEYRVHVFNGKVIDKTQKRKMSEERRTHNGITQEDASRYVRNHMKGWCFTRKDMTLPEGLDELSIAAVNALGLDFGAVDIAWNRHYNQLRVFEINTAVGFEERTTTHMRYTGAISKQLGMPFTKDEYCEKYNCELENDLL